MQEPCLVRWRKPRVIFQKIKVSLISASSTFAVLFDHNWTMSHPTSGCASSFCTGLSANKYMPATLRNISGTALRISCLVMPLKHHDNNQGVKSKRARIKICLGWQLEFIGNFPGVVTEIIAGFASSSPQRSPQWTFWRLQGFSGTLQGRLCRCCYAHVCIRISNLSF